MKTLANKSEECQHWLKALLNGATSTSDVNRGLLEFAYHNDILLGNMTVRETAEMRTIS